ncbi:MAG TPA: glycosyltransferase [Burkholderiaceae bacterium]|nr:glycosyltransferase [Burkholderiaceae bacterium]
MPGHLVDVTMFWSAQGGGVSRYLRTKQRWLAARPDWRHTIAVPAVLDTPEDVHPLPSVALPASGGYRLALRRARCADELAALAPTLIEAGDPYRLAWSALDAGQRLGVPVIGFCHSDIVALAARAGATLGPFASRYAARRATRYLRHVYDGMQRVLAPSRWMAQRLRDCGVERVLHQPLGVDVRAFRPAPPDRQWRATLGARDDTCLLLYAGRFAPEKNLDVLVSAVERLGERFMLVLVGAGPWRPRPSPRVRVVPYLRSEKLLARMLSSADLFVHAGDQETCGLAILEAFACGTPVVARAAAGMAELLDTPAAAAVPATRANAFADAIHALACSNLCALRNTSRIHALRHDWQAAFAQLLQVYAQVQGIAPTPQRRVAYAD